MAKGQARAPSQRQLRVGEQVRHVLADVLERGHIRDEDVASTPVTVTEVRVSPDLKNATVFVVPLGGGDPTRLLAGLDRVKTYLRREVAHSLALRYAPNLSFTPDTSFDEAAAIDTLLHRPEVARDLDRPQDDED